MLTKTQFGITKDGEYASRYIMRNNFGMEAEVSDFGALVIAMRVPNKINSHSDVVLGFDTLEEYYDISTGIGAYVGRNGNRIEGASVIIDGVEYKLDANNNGNNLHSGYDRSHTKLYEATMGTSEEGSYVEFYRLSPHMEQGFPGNLKQKIRYTLTDKNEFVIDYEMVSDKATVVNPTNHSYFNLSGHDSGTVLDQEMTIYADGFLPTDENLIPTGEIADVTGTPMDFRQKKLIGKDILADYLPLKIAGGYDHNYVLPNDGNIKKAAALYSPRTGIGMEVYTDLCGLQVYSGNFLAGERGKDGAKYKKNCGICFETQFYPNACKEPAFPTSILPAGKIFRSRTIYKFTVMDSI